MGRKKKGECSRDQLLKAIEEKEPGELSEKLPKSKTKKTTKGVKANMPEKPGEISEKLTNSKAKKTAKGAKANMPEKVDMEVPLKNTSRNLSGDEDDWEDEVFDESLDDLTDDMLELTRLMSVVEIGNDPDELEKQINLAGLGDKIYSLTIFNFQTFVLAFQQFLIRLPPSIHPAVKGHLTDIFKSLVTFPDYQSLENHPSITLDIIEDKLHSLSEIAGISFSLSLSPPTYHCLKCDLVLLPQLGLSTNVMVFDLGGPRIATKYRYRYLLHFMYDSV